MRKWLWTAAALALLHGSAIAQQGVAPESDGAIVVSGEREKLARERGFVEAVAAPSHSGQLARFAEDICPLSFGLGEQDSQKLMLRMRRVATSAGIPVGKQGCKPNIIILFVPDRQKAINHWRTRRPDFFNGLTPGQLKRLADGAGPVAAWQILLVKGAGGRPMGRTDADGQDYLVNLDTRPSRITSSIEIEFSASFVLIEQKAIGNASIVQLADYAAMRTLANTDPDAGAVQKLPTILSLFAESSEPVPLSVTQWDLSYLSALYKARLAASGNAQQRSMAKQIRSDAVRAADDPQD